MSTTESEYMDDTEVWDTSANLDTEYSDYDTTQMQQWISYLHESDLNEIQAPDTRDWNDADNGRMRTIFSINASRDRNWALAKEEADQISKHVSKNLLDVAGNEDVDMEKLVTKFLGPSSSIGKVLKGELDLDDKGYLKFMSTFCIQAAYRVSTTKMYADYSLFYDQASMTKRDYIDVWGKLAHKHEKQGSDLGTGRREELIWQKLEREVNKVLREVSIEESDGRTISIALDDDKVWYNFIGKKTRDTFGIKITRHVKDNRIGMILHTAISSGLNIPLGVSFERVKDKTVTCYKRIFASMFGVHGGDEVDLLNVNVHSDRGYTFPSIVFDYLIACGANVVGTVKRSVQCWPYNFSQRNVDPNDKRTYVDAKGAPTLYLKQIVLGGVHRVWAAAFRNGSEAVSTAVSSLHKGFEWEGVTDEVTMQRMYEEDPTSLRKFFFKRLDEHPELFVPIDEDSDDDAAENAELLKRVLTDLIDALTLLQGKAKHNLILIVLV